MPVDRKVSGYSTVTHFNLVHVDCHMAALRLQRGRDEWESAMLQNANTKCNGLLPLWGPQVEHIRILHEIYNRTLPSKIIAKIDDYF